MERNVYRVRTQYIFEGVFEVAATNREETERKILEDCGMVMGRGVHSTLPDNEINSSSNALNNSWAFDRRPNKRIDRITRV